MRAQLQTKVFEAGCRMLFHTMPFKILLSRVPLIVLATALNVTGPAMLLFMYSFDMAIEAAIIAKTLVALFT